MPPSIPLTGPLASGFEPFFPTCTARSNHPSIQASTFAPRMPISLTFWAPFQPIATFETGSHPNSNFAIISQKGYHLF
ncbi:predicted protein [Sclerotinia sclerotiorum 1980 UF-70]|uniref:Uncharacterized protein n=1 Tax=Sclerotinia sclerotiorum (strain ATCC 18683 / 1980 / Ss-1) TaxID=665079 RepID=A7F1L8_SCLS1|nr:predicted protein [Sclerotinia sclerotiorum 1980 UF-70]EDN95610.1 predicted protein [Sclerotinia sclerotiorum 1980 UF-70]